MMNSFLKNHTQTYQFVHVSGLGDSGKTHWQTTWEELHPSIIRVQQTNWETPNATDWITSLANTVRDSSEKQIVLIAHSLGCIAIVQAAMQDLLPNVVAAFLVAPADVEQLDFPATCTDFAPISLQPLPFPTLVVASSNDVWCSLEQAHKWSKAWNATFINIGEEGHICGAVRFVEWKQGQLLLLDFLDQL